MNLNVNICIERKMRKKNSGNEWDSLHLKLEDYTPPPDLSTAILFSARVYSISAIVARRLAAT